MTEGSGGCEWRVSDKLWCEVGDGDPPVGDGAQEGGNGRGAKRAVYVSHKLSMREIMN